MIGWEDVIWTGCRSGSGSRCRSGSGCKTGCGQGQGEVGQVVGQGTWSESGVRSNPCPEVTLGLFMFSPFDF